MIMSGDCRTPGWCRIRHPTARHPREGAPEEDTLTTQRRAAAAMLNFPPAGDSRAAGVPSTPVVDRVAVNPEPAALRHTEQAAGTPARWTPASPRMAGRARQGMRERAGMVRRLQTAERREAVERQEAA